MGKFDLTDDLAQEIIERAGTPQVAWYVVKQQIDTEEDPIARHVLVGVADLISQRIITNRTISIV